MSGRLETVMQGTSAQAISGLLRVLFPDARTVADLTFGNGRFWDGSAPVAVTGLDINPTRAKDVCGDFTRLPFRDDALDVCVFDPPYITHAGANSIMGARFGSFASVAALREAVEAGCREAWRVARLGVIVKIQNHKHGGRFVHMTRWVADAVPAEVYDELHLLSPRKIEDGRWGEQLSLRSVHATFLAFRKDGATHKRRRVPA